MNCPALFLQPSTGEERRIMNLAAIAARASRLWRQVRVRLSSAAAGSEEVITPSFLQLISKLVGEKAAHGSSRVPFLDCSPDLHFCTISTTQNGNSIRKPKAELGA